MKPVSRGIAALFLAAAALAGGCASQPASTGNRLLIDGQPLEALLPASRREAIQKRIPAGYRGSVIISEAMGRVIEAHQRIAVDASNAYLKKAGKDHPKLAGWLVVRHGGGLKVLFISEPNGRPRVVATARDVHSGAADIRELSSPRALDEQESALWRARGMAFKADIRACSPHYLPVVIPVVATGTRQIYVYLLPLGKADEIMLGGYYRIKINAAATRIVDTHGFTRACLKVRRNPKAIGAAVTETESPTPTAPQVYANLRYGLDLYVNTVGNHLRWKIADGKITVLHPSSGQ